MRHSAAAMLRWFAINCHFFVSKKEYIGIDDNKIFLANDILRYLRLFLHWRVCAIARVTVRQENLAYTFHGF